MSQIGQSITAARKQNKMQYLYVHREEDAEIIIDMLNILSTMSEYAFMIEVRYVRLN